MLHINVFFLAIKWDQNVKKKKKTKDQLRKVICIFQDKTNELVRLNNHKQKLINFSDTIRTGDKGYTRVSSIQLNEGY